MSVLLVLWILLNSKTFADSRLLDQKEQAHQNSGCVGVYFETEAEMSKVVKKYTADWNQNTCEVCQCLFGRPSEPTIFRRCYILTYRDLIANA